MINNIVRNCKPDSIPQTKPYPKFFNQKVDSQTGNSLKNFNLLLRVFGWGGWIKAVIKSIINLSWKFTPKLK